MAIRDVAKERVTRLKQQPSKPKPALSPDAKQIKVRQEAERLPEGNVRRKPR